MIVALPQRRSPLQRSVRQERDYESHLCPLSRETCSQKLEVYTTLAHETPTGLTVPRVSLRQRKEKGKPDTEFHMEAIVNTTSDLFGAGTETVSTTLRYGLMILLKHPDVE
ncbi:unnamed protein product, partial [Ranitomeya imitator]